MAVVAAVGAVIAVVTALNVIKVFGKLLSPME